MIIPSCLTDKIRNVNIPLIPGDIAWYRGKSFRITITLIVASAVLLIFMPSVTLANSVAAFTANQTSGNSPLLVVFTDQSTGGVTSWSWDFDNNGVVDSTVQNPIYCFNTAGNYTVRLNVSGPGGSDEEVKVNYVCAKCNLQIVGPLYINQFNGAISAMESNAPFVHIRNTVGNSPATEVLFTVSDNASWSELVPLPVLGPDEQTTIPANDPTIRQAQGSKVTYTAIIDPYNQVPETNEYDDHVSCWWYVRFNGYKGAQYWVGKSNITTHRTYDLFGDLVYSFGNSTYKVGGYGQYDNWTSYAVNWTATNLTVPEGAIVKDARLYVAYSRDYENMVPDNVAIDFNGVRVSYEHWETDKPNLGFEENNSYGLLTYNVTAQYQKNMLNEALFTRDDSITGISPYGMLLAVVYEDQSATRKQIFLAEGFDMLGASLEFDTTEDEATAYIEFSGMNINTSQVTQANLITFCPSGDAQNKTDPGEGNLFVNGIQVGHDVWNYEEGATSLNSTLVSVDARDIKSHLNQSGGTNVIAMQSTTGNRPYMAAAYEFLVIEYPTTTFNLPLVTGWNMVSWPVDNSSMRASDLVNYMSLGVTIVTRYDTLTGSYTSYFQGANPSKNFALMPDVGYLVKAAFPTAFSVVGMPLPAHNITVYNGTNLIGWCSYASVNASDILDRASYLDKVTKYDALMGQYESYYRGANPNKNFLLTAGNGYYISSTSAGEQQLYIGGS